MVPFGLTSVLAVTVISINKVAIVWMAIRGVPPEHRAEVLRATSKLLAGDGGKRKQRLPIDKS